MATVESFRQLLKPLTIASKVLGVEVWTRPGRFLPASYNISFHVMVYFVSTIYTLHKYRHDPLHMMKVLITLGTAVQLYIKFWVVHQKAFSIQEYTRHIEQDILEPYECGSMEEVAVLRRSGRYLWLILRIMFSTLVFGVFIFLLYPVVAYYTKGIVMPLFLYDLPYYDWSTVERYVVNMLFQLNLFVLGCVGVLFADFLIIMFSMYALARADLFIIHLRELEALLNDSRMIELNMAEILLKWMQCMKEHQQSTSTLNSIEDLFGLICFAQVSMGVFTLCNGIILIMLTDWYPTYGFWFVMFVELTIYFLIGQFVEMKVNEMYDAITSTSWYKLPWVNQKEYCFLLCRQQRPMVLTASGFLAMNFESYMIVLKGLYQFLVMLLQYVK